MLVHEDTCLTRKHHHDFSQFPQFYLYLDHTISTIINKFVRWLQISRKITALAATTEWNLQSRSCTIGNILIQKNRRVEIDLSSVLSPCLNIFNGRTRRRCKAELWLLQYEQDCQRLGSQSIVADDKAANIFTYTDTPLGNVACALPVSNKSKICPSSSYISRSN